MRLRLCLNLRLRLRLRLSLRLSLRLRPSLERKNHPRTLTAVLRSWQGRWRRRRRSGQTILTGEKPETISYAQHSTRRHPPAQRQLFRIYTLNTCDEIAAVDGGWWTVDSRQWTVSLNSNSISSK